MTVTDILALVRPLVNDADSESQTWSDADYVVFINDGMRYIFDKCPDSRLASTGQSVASWTAAADSTPTTTLCINDVYLNALVEYVVFRYYNVDSGETRDDQRAASHWKLFKDLLSPRS